MHKIQNLLLSVKDVNERADLVNTYVPQMEAAMIKLEDRIKNEKGGDEQVQGHQLLTEQTIPEDNQEEFTRQDFA